jgi:hypothetical protein
MSQTWVSGSTLRALPWQLVPLCQVQTQRANSRPHRPQRREEDSSSSSSSTSKEERRSKVLFHHLH